MDLLSLVLTLRPLPPAAPTGEITLPIWWGRAAHALLLNVVRQANPPLAESLHDEQNPRPFTVSTLMGHFAKGKLVPDQPYFLRLTAIQSEVAEILIAAAGPGGPLSPGATVQLDYLPFHIETLAPDFTSSASPIPVGGEHPWAAANTYQDLGASFLLARQPAPRRISLQFTSPTTFKSGGMHIPLPLPDLVFGSLLERWNAFAPITFPPETKRYAAECLAVSYYKLSSRAVPMKSGGLRVGAVGEISYASLNYDRYWMSVIAVLAAFALYAGVGAGTAMGLGQCRQVERREARDD